MTSCITGWLAEVNLADPCWLDFIPPGAFKLWSDLQMRILAKISNNAADTKAVRDMAMEEASFKLSTHRDTGGKGAKPPSDHLLQALGTMLVGHACWRISIDVHRWH